MAKPMVTIGSIRLSQEDYVMLTALQLPGESYSKFLARMIQQEKKRKGAFYVEGEGSPINEEDRK